MEPQAVTDQVAQPEQPLQQVKKNPRFFYIIGGIILLILVGGASYYLGAKQAGKSAESAPSSNTPTAVITISSPTIQTTTAPRPTQRLTMQDTLADWKLYEDTIAKFSIKYPPDKQAVIDKKNPYIGFCNLGPSLVSISLYNQGQPIPQAATEFQGYLATTITMQLLQYGQTVDQWINQNCKDSWVLDPNTVKKTVTINDLQATQYTGGQMGIGSFAVIPAGTKIYILYAWPVGETAQMDSFLKMLTSFRILL